MIGAIAGDIIGSVYEGGGPHPGDFALCVESTGFTDDTVLTVAIAHAVPESIELRGLVASMGAALSASGIRRPFPEVEIQHRSDTTR